MANVEAEKLLKVIKAIAFQSSIYVRAQDLGSKDSHRLETVHFMATQAISKSGC